MIFIYTTGERVLSSRSVPTYGWFGNFKKRNPDVDYKTPDHQLWTAVEPNKSDVRCWYSGLRDLLRGDWDADVDGFFSPANSHRVFTCDEILIAFAKGDKDTNNKDKADKDVDNKHMVTVIAGASANGLFLKPYFLSAAHTIDKKQFPMLDINSFKHVHSPNGLLTNETFMMWAKDFDEFLRQSKIKRPVVLLLDDSEPHFNLSVFLFLMNKQIIPYCLPPKLNKLLQPLLAQFFPKLMMAYQACCKRYTDKSGKVIMW